jgi:hypothetical protein
MIKIAIYFYEYETVKSEYVESANLSKPLNLGLLRVLTLAIH